MLLRNYTSKSQKPKFRPNKNQDATNKQYYEITNTDQIRTEIHTTYKNIYKTQTDLDTSPNSLTNFLNSNGDTQPLEELEKRKISRNLANTMKEEEKTHCLFNIMKGSSSPGLDSKIT